MSDSDLAKAYGLPKIHKPGYPLRPIISCVDTPFVFLSKFLSLILKTTLPIPKSRIKNSLDLKSGLKEVSIPDNHIMMSIDVVSLYTNVGKEAVKTSLRENQPHIVSRYDIPINELLNAIDKNKVYS